MTTETKSLLLSWALDQCQNIKALINPNWFRCSLVHYRNWRPVLKRWKITNTQTQIHMTKQQAIQILAQVQLQFVGSGQDHQLLDQAIKRLSDSGDDSPTEPNKEDGDDA